jgi:hypothetical protein
MFNSRGVHRVIDVKIEWIGILRSRCGTILIWPETNMLMMWHIDVGGGGFSPNLHIRGNDRDGMLTIAKRRDVGLLGIVCPAFRR